MNYPCNAKYSSHSHLCEMTSTFGRDLFKYGRADNCPCMAPLAVTPNVHWGDRIFLTETTIHNLFPTPVWIIDLEPERYEPLNKAIRRDLYSMIGDRPPVELGGTLQTNANLHEYDEFVDLTDTISKAAEAALDFLQIEYENFEITGCWANLNPTGGINTPHTHPNNYLSGVYYVQTSEGADSIFFTDPRPQASVVMPRAKEETLYSGNEIVMDAKEGRLLLFRAWLSYGVPVNRSNRDRISVSFNIMFTSYTEIMSKPKWSPTVRLKRA